jgi:VIT1/CCC1 family predicted Fe2+/Mn2+ transporter
VQYLRGKHAGLMMGRLHLQTEKHLVARIGWLRAAVLGANDGIVSTASLSVGMPLAMVLLMPSSMLVMGVSAASLLFPALLGAVGAKAGGAGVLKAAFPLGLGGCERPFMPCITGSGSGKGTSRRRPADFACRADVRFREAYAFARL